MSNRSFGTKSLIPIEIQNMIMFSEGRFLNGQYTVIGKVVKGLDVLDMIKKGNGQSGSISGDPDFMENVSSFK